MVDAGAVGINIEDGTRAPAAFAEHLAAAREAARKAGVDLFINARIDTYLLGLGDPATRLRDTLGRARSYIAAGADGIFVPGVSDPTLIGELATALPVPLNIMAGPGTAPVAALGAPGVARVSLGSAVAQAAYAAARRAALGLYGAGDYETLRHGIDYPELNSLFSSAG